MFKRRDNATWTKPVTVHFPEGGTGTFKCRFKSISQDEFETLLPQGDLAMFDAVVDGVDEVGDEDGNPLPPDQALDAIRADSCCVPAAVSQYIEDRGAAFRRKPRR